jgi:hypothetical protein
MTVTTGAEGGPEPAQCQCTACVERAQKTRVRVGRWITRHSDLTKPPTPLIRWALLLILGLSCWAVGIPLDFKDWLGPIIIAGALILPDVAGFGVAGVRLDLKNAQDAIATLRQDLNAQARATASVGPIYITREAETGLETFARVLGAERDPQETYVPRHLDTDSTSEVRSQLWLKSVSPALRGSR